MTGVRILQFKHTIFSKKFIAILLIVVSVSAVSYFFLNFQKKEPALVTNSNLPYKEKVGEGVWALKNYDPIKQTFATTKVNTNLVENKKALEYIRSLQKDREIYRWQVTLPNKTVFAFGQQLKDGIFPAVKVTNKDGMFVKYYPEGFTGFVKPEVKGNVISWKIAEGITARYTMKEDRVKADYIVDKASSLQQLAISSNSNKYQIEFDVQSGNEKDKKELLKGELMPGGDIEWFTEIESQTKTHFTFPAPVVFDSKSEARNSKQIQNTKYQIQNTGKAGEYSLAIVLDPDQVASATWPLTIDPVVIDATATATGTAYGNGRKILRDGWGNLIAVFDGGTGDDNVWYKNYSATTWTDANIDLDAGAGSSAEIAADLDSTGSAHLAFRNTTASAIQYKPLKINRNASNIITSITTQASFSLDTSTFGARPSLVVANKGGGAGVEKIAIAYGMNSTGAGVGEVRFMQCDVADDCTTAGNWKNASEGKNGSSTCATTAGNAGLPNSATCEGTADTIQATVVNTTHHAVLTQLPGKTRRVPTNAKMQLSGVFSNLSNTLDSNNTTADEIGSLTFSDFIYVGDDSIFSKVTFDITNTESLAGNLMNVEYYNGTIWTPISNPFDNTVVSNVTLSQDGSYLFDEPSNWAKTTVDGSNKYWIRIAPSDPLDGTVSIADFYINDRNSRALLIVSGIDSTDDFITGYATWNDITNNNWERIGGDATWSWQIGTFILVGANWTTFTNFPLTTAVDYKNNAVYVSYVEDLATDELHVKKISKNKDLSAIANWTDTSFPTVTEGTDIALSLTSDGSDIYLFYVLDPGTNSLVFRKCTPSGGGDGNICDNASDWGSEKTLVSGTDLSHPQAVVTKVTGDTLAIDTVYTMPTALDVVYERHYVDLADKTSVVAASGDDASHYYACGDVDGSQNIVTSTSNVGRNFDQGCLNGYSEDHTGIRFQNVTVAQGTLIASAFLDVSVAAEWSSSQIDFTLYGEDVDSSAIFTVVASPCNSSCIAQRTRTTSNTVYAINFDVTTYRFDVTNIVQEIVCRGAANTQPCVGDFNSSGAWASGNALAFLLISSEGGSVLNYMEINSQDNASNVLKPTLQINLVPSGTVGKKYSLGSASQLATGSASFTDLDHPLSASEILSVATDDTNYASVSATTNYASSSAVPAFMFKVNNSNNNNTYKINAQAIVKSTVPTSSKPVYLQVYRGGSTNNWVTMASNSNTAADNDITLTSPTISTSLSEYYFNETPGIGTRYAACTTGTANCWSYWRLYQDSVGTDQNAVLSLDYINISFSSAAAAVPSSKLKGGVIFRGGAKVR